jgi:hypothetical protein
LKFFLTKQQIFLVASTGSGFSRPVRGSSPPKNNLRALRPLQGNGRPISECTAAAIAFLQIPGEPPIDGGDEEFGCDDETGRFLRLDMDDAQRGQLKGLAANGELIFGLSKIDVGDATMGVDGSVKVPPGHAISVIKKDPLPLFDRRDQRNLQDGTGEKHFLLFRVKDVNGLVYSHNATIMSDNLYGTGSDQINLKSQLTACSNGKYTVIPGGKPGYDTSPLESAPGVIDIQIDLDITNSTTSTRSKVRDAARDEAERELGAHFNLSTTTTLTRYVDHALFSLENCYVECGWAAYAGAGSYYQFYQGRYYAMAGVQLHEHGHNMYVSDFY